MINSIYSLHNREKGKHNKSLLFANTTRHSKYIREHRNCSKSSGSHNSLHFPFPFQKGDM